MKINSIKQLLIGTGIVLLSLFSSFSTKAQVQPHVEIIELKVYSENEQKQNCPDKVIFTLHPQPYREGSFATDGSGNLSKIASNIQMTASNNFSVTWVGTLKPNYIKCIASAGISKVDGKDYEGHTNYLRMHFVEGKVALMLDLAGEFDPNDYPLVVLKKGLNNGNPVWTFGGTD